VTETEKSPSSVVFARPRLEHGSPPQHKCTVSSSSNPDPTTSNADPGSPALGDRKMEPSPQAGRAKPPTSTAHIAMRLRSSLNFRGRPVAIIHQAWKGNPQQDSEACGEQGEPGSVNITKKSTRHGRATNADEKRLLASAAVLSPSPEDQMQVPYIRFGLVPRPTT
jgi:hypothetical protein